MNPILLIILIIIGIFSLFLYLVSFHKVYEPSDQYYDHPRTCGPKSLPYCLETKNFYFKNLASHFDYASIEKELNEWLNEVDQNEKHLVEVKYDPQKKSFIAFARENILKSDNVLIHSDKTIFHKLSLTEQNFKETMNKIKLDNDQYVLRKMNLSTIPNILIMSLSYHIFHLEFSKYKPWIMSFPTELPNFFSRMTLYELNTFIKPNKEIYPFVKDYFASLDKEWKNIDYFMKKRMTSEEKDSFFNGHNFTKADYIFARFLIERHGWSIANEKELILFPGNEFFIRKNIADESSYYTSLFKQQQVQSISNTSAHLKFMADRNISKGEIIYQSFVEPRSFLSAIIFGEMPRYDYLDCVTVETFYFEDIFQMNQKTQQFLKWAAESGNICLNLNAYSIAKLKIVGTILNMNNKQIDECYVHLSKAQSNEQQYGIFLQNCANPEWKTVDPRKIPLKSLNATLSFYQDYHKNVVDYLYLRKYYKKDFINAQTLVDYAEEKVKLTKRLIERVKNLGNSRKEESEILSQNGLDNIHEPKQEEVKQKTEI